jgi:hypothetical protein
VTDHTGPIIERVAVLVGFLVVDPYLPEISKEDKKKNWESVSASALSSVVAFLSQSLLYDWIIISGHSELLHGTPKFESLVGAL